MTEQTGRLRVKELHRLLDYLREYIRSDAAVVKMTTGVPDTTGNPIHLDGEAFLIGFDDYLKSQSADAQKWLSDLSYVMEISTYVRNGGIKTLLYRFETGYSGITPDYFDYLAGAMCHQMVDGKFTANPQQSKSTLFQHLKEVDSEDESRVSACITEIDEILLELSRALERVSLKKVEDAVGDLGLGDQEEPSQTRSDEADKGLGEADKGSDEADNGESTST